MFKNYTLRKFIGDIHLWLGLISGIILFIVCLTGTIYTFNDEIQQLAAPSNYKAHHDSKAKPKPADELVDLLKNKYGGQLVYIIISDNPDRSYLISLRHDPASRFGTPYFINQYTGQILGDGDTKLAAFLLWNMDMHRWLHLKKHGGIFIVGSATLIFVVLCLSGLVIWFPKKIKGWKNGLKIKYKAGWKRINHDLHNTLGFYALPLLLVMALSGLCWSFEWYIDAMNKVVGAEIWGEYYAKKDSSDYKPGIKPLDPHQFVKKSDELFPYAGQLEIFYPADSFGVVSIQKKRAGFFALAAEDKANIDQYTAKPLKIIRYEDKNNSEKLVSLLRPIHIGSIYGLTSKIIYFIACLIATSLPITGTFIWYNKLRKKPRSKT